MTGDAGNATFVGYTHSGEFFYNFTYTDDSVDAAKLGASVICIEPGDANGNKWERPVELLPPEAAVDAEFNATDEAGKLASPPAYGVFGASDIEANAEGATDVNSLFLLACT